MLTHLRKSWVCVGQGRDNNLGKLGRADPVRDLSTRHDGYTVAFLVCKRDSKTHGVAIAAEHASFVLDLDRLLAVFRLGGRNSAGGTSGYDKRDLAQRIHDLVVNQGRFSMIPQKGDIRAVHGPTHIQAAGHGDPDLGRKLHSLEVIKKIIHHRLDHG